MASAYWRYKLGSKWGCLRSPLTCTIVKVAFAVYTCINAARSAKQPKLGGSIPKHILARRRG